MPELVICITGMPGSGKSTAAQILQQRGFKIIELGAIVKQLMLKKRITINVENVGKFSINLRKQDGADAVAKLALPLINRSAKNVVVSGIRSIEEIKYIKSKLKHAKVYVITITANRKLRFNRSKTRKRTDQPRTFTSFVQRDKRETPWGLDKVIRSADLIIANHTTKTALRNNLKVALAIIAKGKVN